MIYSGCRYIKQTREQYYPIIFVHGHNSYASCDTGWATFYPVKDGKIYPTVLTEIIGYNGYGWGKLENGESAIYCTVKSNLKRMKYPRCIYNFSFYGNGVKGRIGSNGNLKCLSELHRIVKETKIKGITIEKKEWYEIKPVGSFVGEDVEKGPIKTVTEREEVVGRYTDNGEEWAKNFVEFVNKVLKATGSKKVNVVAHSMGGIVVRSAMKWYGIEDKINRLVLLGTPNHPFQDKREIFYMLFFDDPDWMKRGEDWEMDVDGYDMRGEGVVFEDINNNNTGEFLDLLGDYVGDAEVVCIAGTDGRILLPNINIKGLSIPIGNDNDGCVNVGQVFLSTAVMNKRIKALHVVSDVKDIDKSLVGNRHVISFVKHYICDTMGAYDSW